MLHLHAPQCHCVVGSGEHKRKVGARRSLCGRARARHSDPRLEGEAGAGAIREPGGVHRVEGRVQPPGAGVCAGIRKKPERACADYACAQHRRGGRGLGRGETRRVATPKAALGVAVREEVGGPRLTRAARRADSGCENISLHCCSIYPALLKLHRDSKQRPKALVGEGVTAAPS